MAKASDEEKQKHADWGRFIWMCAVVVALQILLGAAIYYRFNDWSERGTFGDMFGAVNSLFSGLAFVGVIYAIYLQQQELKLQREELKLTREAMEKTAAAQERTAELMGMEVDLVAEQHQAHMDRERAKAVPVLRGGANPTGTSADHRQAVVGITNYGGVALNLEIEMEDSEFAPMACVRGELFEEDKWDLNFSVPITATVQRGTVSYEDVFGTRYFLPFELPPEMHSIEFFQSDVRTSSAQK